jgi:SSS family solute:Na+ symporter
VPTTGWPAWSSLGGINPCGLTSAIYNEVLQFFLIVAGFVPLVVIGLIDVGGWDGLSARLAIESVSRGFAPGALTESWQHMGTPASNPMGVEWFGLVMGLGFVLSFGYWCTDFLVVQRAMAADSMNAARRTPLIAAVPKMLFPALVILPGMIAIAVAPHSDIGYAGSGAGGLAPTQIEGARPPLVAAQAVPLATVRPQGLIPPKLDQAGQPVVGTDGRVALDYDLAIPMMLQHYFPAGMLGLGLCALMASFMSGMAGNTTAFNTVWTYDIYQSYIKPDASDAHYLAMGRAATVFGIAISVAAAFVARQFNNIMDLLQLVFAFVNAPLFATFMLGMFWKRATGHGAFIGLLSGTLAAAVHHGLTLPAGAVAGFKGGFIGSVMHPYPSEMAQNFWTAIFAWTTCLLVTIFVSLFTEPRRDEELTGLVYSLTPVPQDRGLPWHKRPGPLAIGVGAATIVLNLIFW